MRATNRVVVNTVIQYSRLVISALISLVSVRLILGALGEDDYGLYDVIAGVIGLIGFISSSLSMTSTRFLSISLGKNDEEGTRNAFNSCFWMHLLMAAGLVLVLELVSFYVFDGYLKILPDRLQTAKWIYQCMLVSLFLSISVTPFISMLVSHENFVYVSLVYIVDAVCKLGIAIVITKYSHDRLLLYGILMMLITFLNVLCFVVYCMIRYRRLLRVRVVALKELGGVSGFAGWTMLDALGATLSRQGYAVLLNRFFGTTVNAVFALARQVETPVYTISASIIDSMKPQIMKSYGAGDERKMMRLSLTAGKLGFAMMSMLALPLLIMMPEVLDLWLKEYLVCGDMNVAHQEIDLKNPSTNRKNAGFTDEERACMDQMLAAGFADTWRQLHPEEVKYSWWSYRMNARERNAGWRIDYFLVSSPFMSKVVSADIHNEIYGSDHCPVELVIC